MTKASLIGVGVVLLGVIAGAAQQTGVINVCGQAKPPVVKPVTPEGDAGVAP